MTLEEEFSGSGSFLIPIHANKHAQLTPSHKTQFIIIFYYKDIVTIIKCKK